MEVTGAPAPRCFDVAGARHCREERPQAGLRDRRDVLETQGEEVQVAGARAHGEAVGGVDAAGG